MRDRRKVLIVAGVAGAGLGALALARNGSSSGASDAPVVNPLAQPPGDFGVPSGVYNASAADDAFMDSSNAQTIVEWLQGIGGSLENLAGTVVGLQGTVADLQGATAIAPPAPVAPAPVAPTPAAPVTAPPSGGGTAAQGLPRWTPAPNAAIGSATDIAGATFAGRVRLTNGQYAPIVKYRSTGTTQIHPEWQRWMQANGVRKA